MDNETLKTILKLQEENTLYERAIKEAIGIVSGFNSNLPLFDMEDVDYLLTELHKLFSKKENKDADPKSE